MSATQIVETAWLIAGVYLIIGVIAAIAIHAVFLPKMDSRTEGAGVFFRLLITPGLVLLWPIMLLKALRPNSAGPTEGA